MAAAALLVSSAVSLAVVQRRRRVLAARAEQPAASAQNTRYREKLVPIREEFVGKKTPADTQVAVSALGRPEWLIEVEAIAVK
jgi:enamine deaminase RidA (YjgF/YER057c/UK114 family)